MKIMADRFAENELLLDTRIIAAETFMDK